MSTTNQPLIKAIIKRTLVVPTMYDTVANPQDSNVSRQLDVALINVGFKADAELLGYVAGLERVYAVEYAQTVIEAVQELLGDHVKHNVYFKNFPEGVPDTIEFWAELVLKTYGEFAFAWNGNLLALDGYGKYQHTYEEMVREHEAFIYDAKEKLRVIRLGDILPVEAYKLYKSLAQSKTPANTDDLTLLKRLAEVCLDNEQPTKIPVRENKSIINVVRIENGKAPIADTVTDILRLAVSLSGGDVSLSEKTKFVSFPRSTRRALLAGLDNVVKSNPAKLGDVYKHREQFKRLAKHLQLKGYPNAEKVFDTARKGVNLSFDAKLERAFEKHDMSEVFKVLSQAPGLFAKNFNRAIMKANLGQLKELKDALEVAMPKMSTPVLVGLRQYLGNRTEQKTNRLFINRKGTGKVIPDTQPTLHVDILNSFLNTIDREIRDRLPEATYVINRDVLGVALPLSNKQTGTGFGVLPRGSKVEIHADIVRLFTYWKEKRSRTDFDLSAIGFDEEFRFKGQVSFTNLRDGTGIKHSGDITSAPEGASEFIDIPRNVPYKYLVPQVNVYSGEGFAEVEESFFGYMERTVEQKGKPCEATTVRTKSEMRGSNRVALPLVLEKTDNGWVVKWVNAFIKGQYHGNRTETNKITTADILQSVVEKTYLDVQYLVDLLEKKEGAVVLYEDEIDVTELQGDVAKVFVGLTTPSGLPDDFQAINLTNLHELLY